MQKQLSTKLVRSQSTEVYVLQLGAYIAVHDGKATSVASIRHSRAGGNPERDGLRWIPACAGMTAYFVAYRALSAIEHDVELLFS